MKPSKKSIGQFKKNVLVLVSVCAICLSTTVGTAQAETPKPKCDEVLTACVEYTQVLEKESKILKDVIKRQDDKLREADSNQGMPWYFYVMLGVTGAFVFQGFTK